MKTSLAIGFIARLNVLVRSQANFPLHGPSEEPKSFWRLPCRGQSGIGRVDPLMDTGDIGAHVHTIAGGNGFGFNATYETLAHSTCTSCAVMQDKSAYWTPALYFMYLNGSTVMVEQVGGMLAYYKAFPSTKAFPEGFRMVTGDPYIRNFSGPFPDIPMSDATVWKDTPEEVATPEQQLFLMQRALGFNCLNYNVAAEGSLYRHQFPTKAYMDRQCVDGLRLELAFPSCGNGSLDSEDHHSHMKYPSLVQEGQCPTGYQVKYPLLFYETIYNTWAFAGIDGQFLLSYGDPIGTGYHGDFIMGWESENLLQDAMDTCRSMSGQVKDCPLFDLQPTEDQEKCHFAVPEALRYDNPTGPRNGLAVDVPIQYGPQQATNYSVAGQSGVPTSHFEPSPQPRTFIGNLSIHPYGAVANPTLMISATGDSMGSINFAPSLSTPVRTWMPPLSPITYVSGVIASEFSKYLSMSPTEDRGGSGIPSGELSPPACAQTSHRQPVSVKTTYKTMGDVVVQLFIEDVEFVITTRTTITMTGAQSTLGSNVMPAPPSGSSGYHSVEHTTPRNIPFNTIMWIFGSETYLISPTLSETSKSGRLSPTTSAGAETTTKSPESSRNASNTLKRSSRDSS